jgi:hypothetical protein
VNNPSYYIDGLLTQGNAALARAYLGITGGGGGVPLAVSSFSNSIGVVEKGSSVASANLAWAYNNPVTSQSLDNGIGSLLPTVTTYHDVGPWTSNRTWTLTGSYGTDTVHATTSILFESKRYWGPQAATSLTDGQIIALSSEFGTSFGMSHSITCAAQYLYFAFPASFGIPTVTVNGLVNTAWTVVARAFVNASSYNTSYNIYRSNNLLTGTYLLALI